MLDFGYRHVTNPRWKAYCSLITDIATGLADDASFGQAPVIDQQMQLPARLHVSDEDRFGAFIDAFTAESALAASEIDFRVSGCTAYDDALRAGVDTFTTGRAAFDELPLGDCPGRAYRCRGRYGGSSEQIASADVNFASHDQSGSGRANY